MVTKRFVVPSLVFIVISQCSGVSVWQAIKDFKNTVIIPDDVIDMRTKAPWPNCAQEGQQGDCRKKRETEGGRIESNLADKADNSNKTDTTVSLQDEETGTGNFTIKTENKTIQNTTTENNTNNGDVNDILINNISQPLDSCLTMENITSSRNNSETNNCTIIIVDINEILENNTVSIVNTSAEYENYTAENKTQSGENATYLSEEINDLSNDFQINENTTVIQENNRNKRQITDSYEDIKTNISETKLNANQNSNLSMNHQINLTLEASNNSNLTLLQTSENYVNKTIGNYTITNFDNVNNTVIYSDIYNDNLTLYDDINEDNLTSSNEKLVNDLNTNTTTNEINILNYTHSINEQVNNSTNLSDLQTNKELLQNWPSNNTLHLVENEFQATESITTENQAESNTHATVTTEEEAENVRRKRQTSMNLTSSNTQTASNKICNEANSVAVNLTSNQTFTAENITTVKLDTSNKSASTNESAISSAPKDTNVAATTEKVCLIQGEVCTNSTQCCENFECTMFDIIKWSSNCDFKPADPLIQAPLPDIRLPKKIVAPRP